jgi:hypothetical protein
VKQVCLGLIALAALFVGCAKEEAAVKPIVPMPEERASMAGGGGAQPATNQSTTPEQTAAQPATNAQPQQQTKPTQSVSRGIE